MCATATTTSPPTSHVHDHHKLQNDQGYVLRVPSNFRLALAGGITLTRAQAASQLVIKGNKAWVAAEEVRRPAVMITRAKSADASSATSPAASTA